MEGQNGNNYQIKHTLSLKTTVHVRKKTLKVNGSIKDRMCLLNQINLT